MKKCILLLLAFCGFQLTHAQIGFTPSYAVLSAPGWKTVIQNDLQTSQTVFLDTYGMSLDFAFRLKKVNIDLLPELSYFNFYQNFIPKGQSFQHDFNLNVIGINFASHIYFLDLKGDSRLSAVEKKGSFLKNNLFLRPSVGIKNFITTYVSPHFHTTSSFIFISAQRDIWAADVGLGLGLDIGLADFLTLSPIIEVKYAKPSEAWLSQARGNAVIINGSHSGPLPPSGVSTLFIPENARSRAVTTMFGIRMEVMFW